MLTRRRIAGMLAMCAFALSYSEALTAAVCTMDTSAEMAMEMPMSSPMEHNESETQQPDCPLSMPGSAANCVFSSALVPVMEPGISQFARRVAASAGDAGHYQLLLAHSAFHPPKA